MGHKVNKNKFIMSILILFLLVENFSLSEKITDYVDKKDVQNINKIFIYKETGKNTKEAGKVSEADIAANSANENKNKQNVKEAEKENKAAVTEKLGEIELEYRDVKEISEKLDGLSGFKIIGIDNRIIFSGDEKKFKEM